MMSQLKYGVAEWPKWNLLSLSQGLAELNEMVQYQSWYAPYELNNWPICETIEAKLTDIEAYQRKNHSLIQRHITLWPSCHYAPSLSSVASLSSSLLSSSSTSSTASLG